MPHPSCQSNRNSRKRGGGREREREDKANGGGGSDGYRAAPSRAVACASKIVAELWSITTAHNRTHTQHPAPALPCWRPRPAFVPLFYSTQDILGIEAHPSPWTLGVEIQANSSRQPRLDWQHFSSPNQLINLLYSHRHHSATPNCLTAFSPVHHLFLCVCIYVVGFRVGSIGRHFHFDSHSLFFFFF